MHFLWYAVPLLHIYIIWRIILFCTIFFMSTVLYAILSRESWFFPASKLFTFVGIFQIKSAVYAFMYCGNKARYSSSICLVSMWSPNVVTVYLSSTSVDEVKRSLLLSFRVILPHVRRVLAWSASRISDFCPTFLYFSPYSIQNNGYFYNVGGARWVEKTLLFLSISSLKKIT